MLVPNTDALVRGVAPAVAFVGNLVTDAQVGLVLAAITTAVARGNATVNAILCARARACAVGLPVPVWSTILACLRCAAQRTHATECTCVRRLKGNVLPAAGYFVDLVFALRSVRSLQARSHGDMHSRTRPPLD